MLQCFQKDKCLTILIPVADDKEKGRLKVKKLKSKTYRINNCFCRATEKEKGTLNQAPVTILWSNKMGLVSISFRHYFPHILHREMFVQWELL
jgi:hypothetical protein